MITPPASDRIRWTFVVPGLLRPTGGNFVLFEYANAIARRGHNAVVRVVHIPTGEGRLQHPSDIPWFTFDPAVEHVFLPDLDPDSLPDAEIIVYTIMAIDIAAGSEADASGRRLVDRLQAPGSRAGLPVLLVQALGIFRDAIEKLAFRGSGPKVCVADWIARALVADGLPPSEVVHIPNGIDHRTFHVTQPIRERRLQVAMNFNAHPLKQHGAGVDALRRLHRECGVPSILFGARHPAEPLGPGLRFELAPRQAVVAETICNGSTMYLQPSLTEGFGMSAVEAMACGCALVTPANGGSDDYAFDGDTALVCEPNADGMAEALVRLVMDDDLRVRLAESGRRFVERFRWEASAERLARVAGDVLSR